MSINIKKPPLNNNKSNTEQRISNIEKYLSDLCTKLNYELNHLDESNFVENIADNIRGNNVPEATQKAIDELEQSLKEQINNL